MGKQKRTQKLMVNEIKENSLTCKSASPRATKIRHEIGSPRDLGTHVRQPKTA